MQEQQCRYIMLSNRGAAHLKTNIGVSLIEYMVAISLGVTILSFVFEVYVSMKASHRFIDQIHNLTSEARTLIALVTREVHVAGRMGCERMTDNHLLYDNANQRFQVIYPMIVGKQHARFMHTQSDFALLLDDVSMQSYIEIASSMPIHKDDVIIISDCINSELAHVSAVQRVTHDGQRVYITNPLHFQFKRNSMVAKRVVVDIFFQHDKNKGIVYMAVNGYRTPIAEHVENLLFSQPEVNSIAFEFEVVTGKMRKKWYGYAATR